MPMKPSASTLLADIRIAYFSMEIAIHEDIPTYAGGLGILAGDMLKSATDLGIPMVGVSLLYTHGYAKQTFDQNNWQNDEGEAWDPTKFMTRCTETVELMLDGRKVKIAGCLYRHKSTSGRVNPIVFLDTNLPENAPEDRGIVDRLYLGDQTHRLFQEAVLGIGGMKMLASLGGNAIGKYHMNEGHSALLILELLKRFEAEEYPAKKAKDLAVFTTHTPVAAGHDQFPRSLAEKVIGQYLPAKHRDDVFLGDQLNMTMLALAHSGYVNGVAKRHGEVTREMFPGYAIDAITNGVHAQTWVSGPLARLYDRYLPGWAHDPYSLRYALALPIDELDTARREAKAELIALVKMKTGIELSPEILTLGFARRATPYKRAEFLLSDIARLEKIAGETKGLQIVFAGKAHPYDQGGKLMLQRIKAVAAKSRGKLTIVYLDGYDMKLAKILVAGVDLWLNTPLRPQEASGTSGMKAALNGVPHLSILDGWWIEGHIEHVTGWSIGGHPEHGETKDADDLEDLYAKLEYVILPKYYSEHSKWLAMARSTIAINGSFFNTHRMVEQYVLNAYFK